MLAVYYFVTRTRDASTLASTRATNRRETGQEHNELEKEKTWGEILKLMLVIALPVAFVNSVVLAYILGVFKLFALSDNLAWKTSVNMLALGIKIVGNKLMLELLKWTTGVGTSTRYCFTSECPSLRSPTSTSTPPQPTNHPTPLHPTPPPLFL